MIEPGNGHVDSRGVRLAVRSEGEVDAPAILLVHGYPDNSSVWDRLVDELAPRFQLVRYDVRGAGESGAPADRSGYHLDHLAADLTAVARAIGKPVHLVAHDWGSIQAWHAVTEPEYAPTFASFTTISGPCLHHIGGWMREQARERRFGPLLGQLAHSWYIGAFQVPVIPETLWRRPWLRGQFRADERDAVNGLELYRANMPGTLRDTSERRTDVPVQQVVLQRDAYVRPAMLAAAAPFCTDLRRVELDAKHWAPRTHPRQLAELITGFVRTTTP